MTCFCVRISRWPTVLMRRPLRVSASQPNAACQELLHHALLDGTYLPVAGFEGGDLGVHVREHSGDGRLLCHFRYKHLNALHDARVKGCHCLADGYLANMRLKLFPVKVMAEIGA